MITDKDIEKLKEAFATKDDLKEIKDDLKAFATKDDFKELKLDLISAMEKVFPTRIDLNKEVDKIRDDFSDLQTSVDTYAKKADTYFQEMIVLSHKVSRMEK